MSKLYCAAIKFNRPISYTGKSSVGDNIFLYAKGSDMENFDNDLRGLKSSVECYVSSTLPKSAEKFLTSLEVLK